MDQMEDFDDAARPSWASPQQMQGMEDGEFIDRRKMRMECVAVEISIEGTKNITNKGSTHTVYVIHVSPGIKSWFVDRRYSDFIYLNQQLQKYLPAVTFPPLPKKTIFSSGNSTRVVEERKQILQTYLQTVAKMHSVWNRTELVRFLDNESNSMMFVWNFERMQKMQQVLSTMTIDNTSKTAQLTSELRTAQQQVEVLQERITRMEMLFLQNAAGVSPIKLPNGVLESISSAAIDIVPITPMGSDKIVARKSRPKTKWSDSFRSKSVDNIAEGSLIAAAAKSGMMLGNANAGAGAGSGTGTDIMDMLEIALGAESADSVVIRPDSDGVSETHDHNADIVSSKSQEVLSPQPQSPTSPTTSAASPMVIKKTPLRPVPENDHEKDGEELELLDIETIEDVIAEHVESGQPLPEDQIIQALNMAYGRQAIQIPNLGNNNGGASGSPAESISADSKSPPPSVTSKPFDPRSGSWSKRGLSKEDKKELKTYAISTQLNHALRISDDVLGAADAHFNNLHRVVEDESIEDTLRDIRSTDQLSVPISSLERLHNYSRSHSSDTPDSIGSENSGASTASLPPAVELIAAVINSQPGRSSPSAYCEGGSAAPGIHPWVGELLYRADLVVQSLLPTVESIDMRHRVFHYLRGVISATLGVQLFPVGSFVSNSFLPGGDVDVTSFLVQQEDENWFVRVNEALCMSSFGSQQQQSQGNTSARDGGGYRRVSVKNVSFVNAEVKIVRSEINGVSVDISANQLAAVYAQAFIMRLDDFVGQDHLFKKSILLVKAWCHFESPRFSNGTGSIVGAKEGRFSSWAVVVMLVWIFHMDGHDIRHPMQALGRFLSYYSCFDWNKYAVTVGGVVNAADLSPVPIPGEASDGTITTIEAAAADVTTRNIVRRGVYFTQEVLQQYADRYANARAASREAFEGNPSNLGSFSGRSEDSGSGSSYAGVSLPPGPELTERRGNWGTTAAFSSSDFYRRGLVNIMSPIIPSVSLTRSVDVIGLMTIRRVFSDGFTSFESMCEGCKASTTSAETQEGNIPTIVKEFWQNTSVFKQHQGYTPKSSFSEPPAGATGAESHAKIDTLASQLDEVEVCLQHAELVLASVVSQPALIRMIIQILSQRGQMPVGEIGKHLHVITGSDTVSKRLKEVFGGLKKAVESANCPHLQIMNDHQFNPTIRLVSNLPVQPSSSPSGLPPMMAQMMMTPSSEFTNTGFITAFDHSTYRLPSRPVSLTLASAAGGKAGGAYRGGKYKGDKQLLAGGGAGRYDYNRAYNNNMSDTASQASMQSHRSSATATGHSNKKAIGGNMRPYASRSGSFGDQYTLAGSSEQQQMMMMQGMQGLTLQQQQQLQLQQQQHMQQLMAAQQQQQMLQQQQYADAYGAASPNIGYTYAAYPPASPVVTSPQGQGQQLGGQQQQLPVLQLSPGTVPVPVQYQYVSAGAASGQMPMYYYAAAGQQQQSPQQQQQYYTNPSAEYSPQQQGAPDS